MSLTFGQAKKILAQYAGKGGKLPTADVLNDFTVKVLQYLLISGSPNAERVFDVYAVNGKFTAPYELEVPLKARVNGRVANVVSKWFEFRSTDEFSQGSCYEANNLVEDANPYYTVYDLPVGGAHVGVLGTADEECDAYIIVQGEDVSGRAIFTNHKGAEISGELLEIRRGVISWSNVVFGHISGIVKTKTNGYAQLHWGTDENLAIRGFLSDYSPIEEVPTYRRFQLKAPCPPLAKVTVLGKARIKPSYADTDRIPFDNLYAIEVAGQQVNSHYNDELQEAKARDEFLQTLVNRESVHKRQNNGNPLEVFYDNSAGTIKGIV